MVFQTHLLRDCVINGRMADPQNYTHSYNTRGKNTGAQSLKDADGAITAASPLQSGLSPLVTPFTRSPLTTTTQTTAQSLFHSVVSNLFAIPKKTKGSTTTAATGTVLPSTPASVPPTVQFITPTVPKMWITTGSTPSTSSVSATVGTPTSKLGTVSTPTTCRVPALPVVSQPPRQGQCQRLQLPRVQNRIRTHIQGQYLDYRVHVQVL